MSEGIVYLNVPFSKVDADKRMVYGEATSEVLDKTNEIMDYDHAKPCFQVWPGNIREMHQPKAVGKAVDIAYDDDQKRVMMAAYVSKGAEDTWQKVLDGTLRFFSVGGKGSRVVEKLDNRYINRVLMDQLIEVSLVDNGAVPTAKFEIVKFADGVATETDVVKCDEVIVKDDKKPAKHKTASGKEGKHYAGVDGTSYPITDPVDVHNAAKAIGRAGSDGPQVKANIIRIAYQMGSSYVDQLPETWKKAKDQKAEKGMTMADILKRMETYDISQTMAVLSALEQLTASEYYEACMEDADEDDKAHVQMLRDAAHMLMAFLVAEWEEQFEELDANGQTADQAIAMAANMGQNMAPGEAAMEKVVKFVPRPADKSRIERLRGVIEKHLASMPVTFSVLDTDGRLYFSKDVRGKNHGDMVQKIHDHTAEMGAMCKSADGSGFSYSSAKKAQKEADKAAKAAEKDGKDGDGKDGDKADDKKTEKAMTPGVQAATVTVPVTQAVAGGQGSTQVETRESQPRTEGVLAPGATPAPGEISKSAPPAAGTAGASTKDGNPGVPAGIPPFQGNMAPSHTSTAGGQGAAGNTGTSSPATGGITVPSPGENLAKSVTITDVVKRLKTLSERGETSVSISAVVEELLAAPAAEPEPVAKAVVTEPEPDVRFSAILKAVQDTQAELVNVKGAFAAAKTASDAEIAKLTGELDVIKSTPRPGGPQTRAIPAERAVPVAKTLGSTLSVANQDASAAEVELVVQTLTNIAKSATSEEARTLAVAELTKIQQRYGLSAQVINSAAGFKPRP